MPTCYECNSKAGKHHILFKGSKSILVYLPINEMALCKKCHKEAHLNKSVDRKYKCLLQTKLQNLLPDKYYSLEDLKAILALNVLQTKILAARVPKNEKGYNPRDVIRYLMCGKLYC